MLTFEFHPVVIWEHWVLNFGRNVVLVDYLAISMKHFKFSYTVRYNISFLVFWGVIINK